MNSTHRNVRGRAGRVSTILLAVLFCLTSARSTPGQSMVPIRTIIPVVFDGSNGNITIGTKTLNGANPGFHLVALKRQPNAAHLDAPDVLWDKNYTNDQDVRTAMGAIETQYPDAMIMVNTAGSYGFPVWAVGFKLVGDASNPGYGGTTELGAVGYNPLAFVGVVGLAPGTAPVSRWTSTRPVTGYMTSDSQGNYTFIQTDFVRYDIGLNGDITVGKTTYTVANSYRVNCNGQNAFRMVIVDREDPTISYANNTYCTATSDSEIERFKADINTLMSNGAPSGQTITDETRLVFIGSVGKPIPANWNFGTDGDSRFYPLGQQIRKLGGYWETIVYLTPNDTYSLVGAPPPPDATPGTRRRARESSSVYPEISANVRPSGELHGVLARSGRGNWYGPLNADPSGYANLGFYDVLAAPYQPFVDLSGTLADGKTSASQYISNAICGGCNIRDLYTSTSTDLDNRNTKLQGLLDAAGKNCDVPGSGADPTFCTTRSQLLTEFTYVSDILKFYGNLQGLLQGSGTVTLASQLNAYTEIKAQLNPPPNATSQSLTSPLVNFFLGLASFIPEVGPVFGLADVAFNFGTSLVTDDQGNRRINLTSTIAGLLDQATTQFSDQATSTGTLFELLFEDWGKLSMLGQALGKVDKSSPWNWSPTASGQMLSGMMPAIRQASYQNIMAAAYAIGSYMPNSDYADGYGWGKLPLSRQPHGYLVEDFHPSGSIPVSHPFDIPAYIPFTYPTDLNNQWYNDSRTATILSDFAWLGISQLDTPSNGTTDTFQYEPPSPDTLTLLFDPVWKKGIGVYRPAFFNGWPFPRVQCTPVVGTQVGDGTSVGGCNWSAAAVAPEHLGAGRSISKTSVTIRAVQTSGDRPRQPQIDVMLTIHNNGTITAQSITIDSITLRTLAGAGQATLLSPVAPIRLTNLKPGESITVSLKLNVPANTPRLSITENGTITSGNSRAPETFKFSEAQSLFVR